MHERYLKAQIASDMNKKMVFVGGARQVGKTTLVQDILGTGKGYLNWDIADDREKILKRELPVSDILALDEIHKYRSWRNYLKGLYDSKRQRIIVTGSARLDFYRFGGDSLQGRYHYLRLFPLSAAELKITNTKELLNLLTLGGFPEPFFSSSEVDAKRWSREYRNRLIREDMVSLERVQDIGNLEMMMIRLPELTGSPLSINSICEDLQVSHKTISKWLDILERLYAVFRLSPFGAPKIRAVKKEKKHYHFDWTMVKDQSIRFENMIALHLLKWVSFQEDTLGEDMELRYFRDTDGREVDFVILKDRSPLIFIEAKWNDRDITKGLTYLKKRFPHCEAWQISATGKKDYLSKQGVRVCPASHFLKNLV